MENWKRFVNEEEDGAEEIANEGIMDSIKGMFRRKKPAAPEVRKADVSRPESYTLNAIWHTLKKNNLFIGAWKFYDDQTELARAIESMEDEGYSPAAAGARERVMKMAKYLTKDPQKLEAFEQKYNMSADTSPFGVFARLFVVRAANDAKLRAIGDKVLDAAMQL